MQLALEHRLNLLRTIPAYFSVSENFLRQLSTFDRNRFTPVAQYSERFGSWKGKIYFVDAHVLNFRDIVSTGASGERLRTISYDFRKEHSEREIFRIDAHGQPLQSGEGCHLEVGDGERYPNGHPFLKGYSLTHVTLLDTFQLIHTFFSEGPMPWQ